MNKEIINSDSESEEQRAKRLVNELRHFIFSDVMMSLSNYDKVGLTEFANYEKEFDDLFSKVLDFDICPDYQSGLKMFADFIKQKIINVFCYGSVSPTYKDIIRIIARFCKEHNII